MKKCVILFKNMCLTLFKSFKMSFRKGKKSQMAFFDTVNAVNVWNI